MNERLNAVVGAKIGGFRRKMAEVKATLKSLPNTVTTRIKVNYNQWRKGMDKIAEASRDFGEIIGRSLTGGIIAAIPALSNVIGVLVGGLGGLASSLTAAGGGLGAFGVAAIGNASKLAENMSEIKKINDKIKSEKQSLDLNQERINELLNERKNILGSLSDAQKSAMKQVNKFKDAWSEFLKVTQKPVFKVFAAGLKVATSLLDKMEPIIKPVSNALVGLLNKFNDFSKTEQFKSFIDFFANRGSSAIKNWGQIAGNILNGFMELMKAFGPLGKDMENGLIGMTKKFAEWAAGLKNSKAFNKFVNFVKTNGPKVLDLIGNLSNFIIELGKGMAPLGSKILNIANSFFSWINGLMKGNPIIGQIVAWVTSLIGVFMALAPIILSIFSAFKLVWPVIATVGRVILGLTNPIGLIITIATLLVTVITKYWDEIAAFTKKIFTSIGNFLSNTWNNIKSFVKVAALLIAKWVVQKFTDIATGIAKFMTNAWNTIKDVWNTVKTFWKAVLITIVKWVVQKFTNFTSKIADFMEQAHDTITGVWEAIKRFFRMILISIVRFVINKFVSLVKGVRNKMNDALDFVTDIGGSIVDFFSDIDLFDSGKKIIQSAIDGILSVKDKITGVVGDIAGKVRDFWPFSPAKTGPLSDINKMDFAGPIGQSIDKAKRPITGSMAKLAASAKSAFKPDLAMANMSVGGTVDASVNVKGMDAIQSGLSVDVSDFELPDQSEQYAVMNIGGHEARGVITYITDEQKRKQEREEAFR